MPDPVQSNPIPEDVVITNLKGVMEFTCCGIRQKVTGDNITHVKCERCNYLFVFHLAPVRLAPDVLVTGTMVTLREKVKTKAGCRDVELPPGSYKVYEDVHGVMGTLEGETLLCVESQGVDRKMRTLLAPVLTTLLDIEEIPSDGNEHSSSGTED